MNALSNAWLKILQLWWNLYVPPLLRLKGVTLGKMVKFHGVPIVSMAKNSTIFIGDRAVICSDSRFTALGVNHPTVLRTLNAGAKIVIGNDCGISGGSICAVHLVHIGAECLLGANVSLSDTDFHPIAASRRRFANNINEIPFSRVYIEDNVFIGMDSTILKGVHVGSNSVVGARSIVTRDVPPNTITAGNPSKTIKRLP